MKRFLLLLFLNIFFYTFSQSKIIVLKASEKMPIYGASIYCDDELIGKTAQNGMLEFKTKCRKVDVVADNFESEEVEVKKTMEVLLKPSLEKIKNIETITIIDKSDERALKILDELNKRFKENAPQSLDSYNFKSYSKISLDIDKDSVKNYQDFVAKRQDSISSIKNRVLKLSEKKKKDSLLEEDFVNTVKESQFFLWEKVSEHNFSRKYGEKTNILDNKISGFQNPIYELMALNISNLNRVPRQVREENRKMYHYYLSDTLEIDGRKTYVIKFKEINNKQKQNPRKFNGKIYVDAENYGLKKIESSSKKRNEGNGVAIWKLVNNKWFLESENLKAKIGIQSFETSKKDSLKKDEKAKFNTKKFGNYIYVKNTYFDFKTNEEQNAKDYKGYALEVKNTDGKLLQQYRTDSLTARESLTYKNIDSLVKKSKFDKKISLFSNILRGKLRYKMLDFDVSKFLEYNRYEGLRLGAGIKLNEKFSKFFSPDVYFGYGFKDKAWKYGTGIDIRTSLKKNSFFRVEYYDDVAASGRFSENLWSFRMKAMNSGVDMNNDRFYHFKGIKFSFEHDIENDLTLRLSAKKDDEEAKFGYSYKNLGASFKNFSTQLTMKYSPNSKNVMTPSGKYTYEQKYPELYLNYEQAMKSFGGDFDYSRIDALLIHNFKTKIGTTGFRIYGGLLSGEAPIWHNFSIDGLSDDKDKLNYNFTSYLGFATMQGGKYYNDKFLGTYLTHRIPWYFRSFGKKVSSFDVVYKGVIGNMKNKEYHQFEFQKLDHLYQEVGLEWNNFLSTSFNVGFFYRVGYYSTPVFKDNFALQLKLKIFGF